MKQIIVNKDNSSKQFLYEQLYLNIKNQILSGDMLPGEKCPSIRNLSENIGVSVTTVMDAYGQLLDEGFIKNKPGSGYYVEHVRNNTNQLGMKKSEYSISFNEVNDVKELSVSPKYMMDENSFDFSKWKKCSAKIYSEYSDQLLFGSDLKGELALRNEISGYLFKSRGVNSNPDNIIIAAGTQQIAFHLGRILKAIGIGLISIEKPGYNPVKSMFSEAQFTTTDIPVEEDGITIENLPVNISSAVYVNPSNQFPTGVVMPASRRYEILKWALDNNSYVVEDDYDSELRYFGKPLPTIKSLDNDDRVIYLGSFSSTLFSAIKISYMVLPPQLTSVFEKIKMNYSQTCSKAEQLTLAYYMNQGYYYTAIRKKRALYAKKLQAVLLSFSKYSGNKINIKNTYSGLTVLIEVKTGKAVGDFIEIANDEKVYVSYIKEMSSEDSLKLAFYYSYIPYEMIDKTVFNILERWKNII